MQTLSVPWTPVRPADGRDRTRRLGFAEGPPARRSPGRRVVMARAAGARLTDVDGKEYVDYALGAGRNLLGHAPDDVVAAVEAASRRGVAFGTAHELESVAAEAAREAIGWADSVRFATTATEAVQAALRAARAVTGRSRFVRFAGHSHGWLDNVAVRPGVECCDQHLAAPGQLASQLDESIMLPWNDEELLADVLEDHHADIAAVITEPLMLNSGAVEPAPGFLEALRTLCDRYGVVLIFDEAGSGFRVALGGGAERYGVTPDLATYGETVAAGWPIAMIAGRDPLVRALGDEEAEHTGITHASAPACAAVAATLQRLVGDPPYAELERIGTLLQDGLAALSARHGIPLHVQGPPSSFHVGLGRGPVVDHLTWQELDRAGYAEFTRRLAEHGVWASATGPWFVSAAHTDADVGDTLDRVDATLTAWRRR